jgi:preprotein translocase subunit SecE
MQEARDNNDEHEEQDEQALESEAVSQPQPREIEAEGSSRALGLSRWVQYVFVVIGVFFFWLLDKVANLVLQTFTDPNPELVTVVSLVLGGFIAVRLYKHEASHRLAAEIVGELAKVSWPSRQETYASSVIVIITSLIAAAIVGSFDAGWSFITDFLYKHQI